MPQENKVRSIGLQICDNVENVENDRNHNRKKVKIVDFWGRKPENDFIRAFEEVTEGHENNHEAQLSTERMEELEIQI